jgi:hypothetical protein
VTRPTINQIVIDDLECQKGEIIKYRLSVVNGIEDYEHPILTDADIIPALDKVIKYYKELK